MEFNCRKDFESSEVGVEIKKHFSIHCTTPLKKTGGMTLELRFINNSAPNLQLYPQHSGVSGQAAERDTIA